MKTLSRTLNLVLVIMLLSTLVPNVGASPAPRSAPEEAPAPVLEAAPAAQEPATEGDRPVLTNPYVSEPIAPTDTRGLPPAPPAEPPAGGLQEARPVLPLPGGERTAGAPESYDPAGQQAPGEASMPAPLTNWEGIAATGVYPPDTDGQVGPDHYVQIVNAPSVGSQVRVWDKAGTQLYDFGLGNLWPGGDPCRSYPYGDPVVLYDQLAGRWLLTQFALPDPPFYECIAISKTGTPTSNPNDWHLYSFLVHNTKMNDYPKLGVWPDGYYMSANQFNPGWAGAGVWVFDRQAMLQGDPASFQYFDVANINSNYGGLLPSNLMFDTLPPAGAPNYYMAVDMNWSGPDDVLHIFEFHTDWTTPANSTFGLVADLVVAPFDWNFDGSGGPRDNWDVPQPGTSVELDSLSDRLMMHLWYRNFGSHESLVVNHTVDVGGTPDHAGVRWYEIRGGTVDATLADASIYQQGTYAPDSEHRWMGSVAMDHVGNIALGYSVSSNSVYPSIRYAGRLASDPVGTLPQAEEEIIAGSGSQTGSAARWGDYSAMSVDPVDDCTFWYTQEYIETTGTASWQTRIAAFQFPSCTGAVGTLEGVVQEDGTGAPIIGAEITAEDQWAFMTYSQAPLGGYSFDAIPTGTYTVTGEAYGYLPQTFTGVDVYSGTVTIQDFNLTPASTHIVDGYITDATVGWPLYASIDIDGYPGDPVWSDPVSGYYSVTLPAGMAYTFTVAAWVDGYLPEGRDVGPLVGPQTEDFALSADPIACTAPGYITGTILFDDFEGGYGNWTMTGLWNPENEADTCGAMVDPFPSSSNGAYYGVEGQCTYNNGSANSGELTLNSAVTLPAGPVTLSFWSFEQTEPALAFDKCYVDVSTDGGASWKLEWDSPGPENVWHEASVDLSAYAGSGALFRYRFDTVDSSFNDYFGWMVDDVSLLAPECAPMPGGLVVGNVYDENTGGALNGALVENQDGYSASTWATPDDPTVDDGFYTLFSPAGSKTFTATLPGYGPDVQIPTVVQNDTIRQDFNLPAGWLSYDPASYHVTQMIGVSTTLPFTLTNNGRWPAGFSLREWDMGVGPLVLSGVSFPAKTRSTDTEMAPRRRLVLSPLAVGDELYQVDVGASTGHIAVLGVEYALGQYWVTSGGQMGSGDPNYLFQLDKDGNVINSWTQGTVSSWGWRDLAFDGEFLYASDSTVIEQIDPGTGAATGVTISCPTNPCRALAYDPATDHFWTANWASNIWEIDRSGAIVNAFPNTLSAYGAAWDAWSPGGPYLWVWSQDGSPAVLATQIDPATGAQTGVAFAGSDPPGGIAGGMDLIAGDHPDYAGMLVLAGMHQAPNDTIVGYDLDAVVSVDVPWLSEDPMVGTVPSMADLAVDVTFDAGVPEVDQPGDYHAELAIGSDTPYDLPNVPITMTVIPPTAWGKLNGVVTGLGYCDADPAPLDEAEVYVEASSGMTWTLLTDESGYYSYWFDQSYSPLTVTVTYTDHETAVATGVMIAGLVTTTVDFDLRWLEPCASADPPAMEVMVLRGTSLTQTLTLHNDGAASTPFEIREQEGTVWPLQLSPGLPAYVGTPRERLRGYDVNATTTEAQLAPPVNPVEPTGVLAAGDVLAQWPTGLALPWGTGFGFNEETAWFSNPAAAGGDDLNHEFETDGTPTGRTVDPTSGASWYGDMAYNPNTGKFWQVRVGGDNCILEWDPATGQTGNSICNPAWTWTSQRGLAYDPTDDTFFIGGWNDVNLYHIDNTGAVIEQWGLGLSISGLAHNFEAGLLFIIENSPTDAISVLDVASGTIVDSFTVTGFGNYVGAGLAIDCEGNLWAANQGNHNSYLVDSGVPADLCGADVPWLDEDPITGTLNADSSVPIDVTFTAFPTMTLGHYTATLLVRTDDPVNRDIGVPVTMTVASAPVCSFDTSSPDELGEATAFANTTDEGMASTIYRWGFGDGSGISAAEHPTHTYTLPGWYTPILTATNPYGQDVCTGTVSIEGVVGGFVSNSPVVLGDPVVFTNTTVANPEIVQYFWTFGDGGSSETEDPSYYYQAAGTYTVTLFAANVPLAPGQAPLAPDNVYDIYQDTVLVLERVYYIYLPLTLRNAP